MEERGEQLLRHVLAAAMHVHMTLHMLHVPFSVPLTSSFTSLATSSSCLFRAANPLTSWTRRRLVALSSCDLSRPDFSSWMRLFRWW